MSARRRKEDSRSEEKAAAFHRIWLAGLGALHSAETEGRELFRKLVERGEEYAEKARPTVERLRERTAELSAELREGAGRSWDRFEKILDERLSAAMSRIGVPDRDEIRRLADRVEELTRQVEALAAAGTAAPAAKRATKKTAARSRKKAATRTAKKTSSRATARSGQSRKAGRTSPKRKAKRSRA
ncbi:MAG: hypothetical protein D6718_00070 [Acidobacteria bacterium]|nr:MAG: hypothetical protein D6718_00070 [Acidobacteriota bacterium]